MPLLPCRFASPPYFRGAFVFAAAMPGTALRRHAAFMPRRCHAAMFISLSLLLLYAFRYAA